MLEPKCLKKNQLSKPWTNDRFEHSWTTSHVNNIETGLCGICGLLRVRVNTQHTFYPTATATYPFHYYQPMKVKK